MMRSSLVFLLNFISMFLYHGSAAQQAQEDFTTLSDSILSADDATYEKFDQLLKPFAKDEFLLQRLIEKSEETGNLTGLSYGYNQLGIINSSDFNYAKAIEYHKNALELAEENRQTLLQLTTLNLLGSVSTKIDSIENALEYHQEVIRLINKQDSLNNDYQREAGKALFGLGIVYHALGLYDLAVEYYDDSIEQFQNAAYSEGLAYSYQRKGESLEALGMLEESISYYQESDQINQHLGSERVLVFNVTGTAHALAHLDRGEEAQRLINSLLDEGVDNLDPELRALLYTQYGWVLNNIEEYELAEHYLTEGLQLAQQLNITGYIYDGNIWLHDLWDARGDYEKALKYYKTAQSTRRKIMNRRNIQFANDVINTFERETKELQLEMLARENEIVNLKLRRNRTTLLTGALLLVLCALILYIAYRQYQINNEKRVMSLEQSRLRSQMNPHFLFNSLNSIKHYIINNEQKNAVHYLNKFSKLVRRILESSAIKENSLQEELETLALYMNIENIRFDEQIDYQVDIAPDINLRTIKIPSLILQPFLENALWHGLSSKEGEKKIRLEVRRNKKGFITIAIRDNGIGREAANKLMKDKFLKRKSLGISITRERLANFSRIYRNSFELSIEDLYKDDGSVAGTQVILKIPTI